MIEREVRGNVAVLRIKHGKVNLMDLELCEALSRALEEVRASQARGVVLTADGHVFSAGVDLRRLVAGGASYVERFLPAMSSLYERVLFFPRPVIAAINGHALAGGCLLVACCDRRFLAKGEWKLGAPELRIGLTFPAPGLEAMRHCVPPAMLDDVVFGGNTFIGEEAVKVGFADQIVDPSELMAYAIDEAERLGEFGETFRSTKEQLRLPLRQFLTAHGHRLDQHALDVWRRPSTLDAVRRYVEMTLSK
jgi:enoyl-CoA hydratase